MMAHRYFIASVHKVRTGGEDESDSEKKYRKNGLAGIHIYQCVFESLAIITAVVRPVQIDFGLLSRERSS